MTFSLVVSWILFGLAVGLIARFIMPGVQRMGWIGTILLGVMGSFVGGFIASIFTKHDPMQPTQWLMSILGALVILALAGQLAKKR